MNQKRKLRSGGACHPLENIFKSDHYREILPPAVFVRVANTPTINCEKIRTLKIEANSDHAQNLKLMKQIAVESRDLRPSSHGKYFYQESNSLEKEQKRNSVQMQHYEQEILNMNFLKQIDQFIMQ